MWTQCPAARTCFEWTSTPAHSETMQKASEIGQDRESRQKAQSLLTSLNVE
jgi:hypothetical protein